MPLTSKGQEIMAAMKKQYGEKKGESVFYASKNAGKISGVDESAGGEVLYNKGHVSGYRVGSEDQSESSVTTGHIPQANAGGLPASSKESPVPSKDRLPAAKVFRQRVRDAVRAGLPLPKIMDLGTVWDGSDTPRNWQGDKASFRKAFKDALAKGVSLDRAFRIAVDVDPDPMTGSAPEGTEGTSAGMGASEGSTGVATGTGTTQSSPVGSTELGAGMTQNYDRRIHFRGSMRDALRSGRTFTDAIRHSVDACDCKK